MASIPLYLCWPSIPLYLCCCCGLPGWSNMVCFFVLRGRWLCCGKNRIFLATRRLVYKKTCVIKWWRLAAAMAASVARSAVGGLAIGGFLYLVGDTASDYLTFSRLRAAALQLAEQDEEVTQLVGPPYTTGMWYNSTLGFSHRDKVAHCTFQLQGSRRVTDIAVKAGRQAGPHSNVLYNIIGPGTWKLISCQAMVPSEGGLVQPHSLLPEHREERQQQQRRGGGGQQQAAQPGSSKQKWWWPFGGRGSSSSYGSSSGSSGACAGSSSSGSAERHTPSRVL